jgi:hypothetical protein
MESFKEFNWKGKNNLNKVKLSNEMHFRNFSTFFLHSGKLTKYVNVKATKASNASKPKWKLWWGKKLFYENFLLCFAHFSIHAPHYACNGSLHKIFTICSTFPRSHSDNEFLGVENEHRINIY